MLLTPWWVGVNISRPPKCSQLKDMAKATQLMKGRPEHCCFLKMLGQGWGQPPPPVAFQWRISRPHPRVFGHRGLSTSHSSFISDGGPSSHVESVRLPQGGSAAPGGGHAEVHSIRTSLHFFETNISPCLPHSCRRLWVSPQLAANKQPSLLLFFSFQFW